MLWLYCNWSRESRIRHACDIRQHPGRQHNNEIAIHRTADDENYTRLCSSSHIRALDIWKISLGKVPWGFQVSKALSAHIHTCSVCVKLIPQKNAYNSHITYATDTKLAKPNALNDPVIIWEACTWEPWLTKLVSTLHTLLPPPQLCSLWA